MATIYIDNEPYEVEAGQNLLHACLSLGFNLPYFCWHPAMHSVGACRQCAVKQFRDEKDTRGFIIISCMTEVVDGMRISIDDPEAKEFRASVIEWLMINHPHDCPVCDEGGECHLQDMTVMTGHTYRKFRFKKRTYRNQYLGPFMNHEMNRCIQCYRCVRFYRDYAGGRDFNVFGIHSRVYFGRYEDGILENEFSGNLVEVCPTGVFTDRTLKKHYTRKWDLQTAPSICVHCAVGCNTIPGERYGMLRRIHNRYNGQVNGYFLCDRGRYGYEFVNSDRRIRDPLIRRKPGKIAEPATKVGALEYVKAIVQESTGVIGIGSPRASLEANFALRTLVGPERFYLGMPETQVHLGSMIVEILRNGPARSPSLHDVEAADAVLILGEDVTNVAPRLALALRQCVRRKPMEVAEKLKIPSWCDGPVRQAVQQRKGPLFIASFAATRLDDVATQTFHGTPNDLARLGFAVAHELSEDAPAVTDLPPETLSLAQAIAKALKEAERPLVVSGSSLCSASIIAAAANVAWALCESDRPAGLSFIVPECNSLGLELITGQPLDAAFKEVIEGRANTAIILENDLYRRSDSESVDAFFRKCEYVIVIDHLMNRSTEKADVVLPAATFAESDGTLVNNEGRAQRFYKVFAPVGQIQESWRWLRDIMAVSGRTDAQKWQTFDDITTAMTKTLPVFEPVLDIAPPAGFRVAGMKIPRQPHRYSGRTSMAANVSVHELKPPDDPDSPLCFSMEGYEGQPNSALIPRFWAPGWNSVQALNKFQSEVGGPLQGGDPGRRLIEPAMVGKVSYFHEIPEAFQSRDDELLILPLYHIFGSEELGILAPGVAERAPKPYLGLNPADADRLEVNEGWIVTLALGETTCPLPVKIIPSLSAGVAALPVGLPGSPAIVLPAWGKILHGAAGAKKPKD